MPQEPQEELKSSNGDGEEQAERQEPPAGGVAAGALPGGFLLIQS